jgi:hypothetical protein
VAYTVPGTYCCSFSTEATRVRIAPSKPSAFTLALARSRSLELVLLRIVYDATPLSICETIRSSTERRNPMSLLMQTTSTF